MPNTEYDYVTSQRNVKSEPYLREMYGRYLLMFPGWDHYELSSIPPNRRREMFADAVRAAAEAQKARLSEDEARRVFSDLEFDLETGEVLS